MRWIPIASIGASSILYISYILGVSFRYIQSPPSHIAFFTALWSVLLLSCLVAISKTYIRGKKRILTLRSRLKKSTSSAHEFVLNQISELRRPLQGLVGIKDLYANGVRTDAVDYFDIVEFCTRHLISQFEKIQFYTEFVSKKPILTPSPFSLREAIDDCISKVVLQINSTEFTIIEDWAPGIPNTVNGHLASFKIVFREILENAVRHASRGKITIRVYPDPNTPSSLCVSVADQGPGLSERQVSEFNSPYKEAPDQAPFPDTNNGLGISLIKNIVHANHGRFIVQSHIGMGSLFTFSFPLGISKDYSQPLQSPKIVRQAVPEVLLAEDDPITRSVLTKMFETLNIKIDIVDSGHGAIEACQRKRYDIVFTDIELPVLDGFEVAKIISNELHLAHRPRVVALSSHSLLEQQEKFSACGGAAFLVKPATISDIKTLVQRFGFLDESVEILTEAPASNVIFLETRLKKQLIDEKAPSEPGYILNFNALYNSLNEDLGFCHRVLLQAAEILTVQLDLIGRAITEQDRKLLAAALHKMKGEFLIIKSEAGVKKIDSLEDLARSGSFENISLRYEDLCQVFESLIQEIEKITATDDVKSA